MVLMIRLFTSIRATENKAVKSLVVSRIRAPVEDKAVMSLVVAEAAPVVAEAALVVAEAAPVVAEMAPMSPALGADCLTAEVAPIRATEDKAVNLSDPQLTPMAADCTVVCLKMAP